MQQRLDAAVTHLITMDTTGVAPPTPTIIDVYTNILMSCRPSMRVLFVIVSKWFLQTG